MRRAIGYPRPISNPDLDVYFWTVGVEGDGEEILQQSTHVTECTPEWCDVHQRGYAERCAACYLERTGQNNAPPTWKPGGREYA